MLEKMSDFFENRIDGYDEHMMKNIMCADEFYPFTAQMLPIEKNVHILDLGCGTGLELSEYFKLNPYANVTGIDLSSGMLEVLKAKFPDKKINLICDSYFDVHFGENAFNAAVSVESLHHFTKAEKTLLYKRLFAALKHNGFFVLTDYFSMTNEEEKMHFSNLRKLKDEQGIKDNEIYHYDTPLTIRHEIEALSVAGFKNIEVIGSWGATHTIKACKRIVD